jgi:hypothetical protein
MALPTVSPTKLKRRLILAEKAKRPMIIRGGPGIGKSDIFKAHAEMRAKQLGGILWRPHMIGNVSGDELENAYGYIDSRVLYFDPTDLKGFPAVDLEKQMSYWLPPGQFPLQRNVDAGHVPAQGEWNFEELPSAPPAVQAATYQVMLDREINGEPIADGWFMVATGNRLGDKGVVSRMPSPLVSRYWHLQLEVSVDQWVEWAMPFGIDERLIAFFKFRPETLMSFDPAKWEQDTPYCCPRTAHILSDLMDAWYETETSKIELDIVQAAVGEAVGSEIYAYLSLFEKLPDIDDIFKDPNGTECPRPDELDKIYALSMALARRVTPDTAPAAYTYIARFPKEFEIGASNAFQLANDEICETRAFLNHVSANQEIYTGG